MEELFDLRLFAEGTENWDLVLGVGGVGGFTEK